MLGASRAFSTVRIGANRFVAGHQQAAWKPAAAATRLYAAVAESKEELEAAVKAKGDEIRALKDSGADKATVAPFVQELLALKAKLDPESVSQKKPQKKKKQLKNQGNNKKKPKDEAESDFITPRSEDYSKWYNDVIKTAGLAESSPVRGCMVIKPWYVPHMHYFNV